MSGTGPPGSLGFPKAGTSARTTSPPGEVPGDHVSEFGIQVVGVTAHGTRICQVVQRREGLRLHCIARETVQIRQRHGLKVPDAIILATATCHGLTLATRNSRDFPLSLGGVVHPYSL